VELWRLFRCFVTGTLSEPREMIPRSVGVNSRSHERESVDDTYFGRTQEGRVLHPSSQIARRAAKLARTLSRDRDPRRRGCANVLIDSHPSLFDQLAWARFALSVIRWGDPSFVPRIWIPDSRLDARLIPIKQPRRCPLLEHAASLAPCSSFLISLIERGGSKCSKR